MIRFIAIWFAMASAAIAALSETPHPRLWFPRSAEPTVLKKIATDPLAKQLHQATLDEATRIIDRSTCRYDIPDGRRLLAQSRLALHNIMHCAWAWRLTGHEKFRIRTIAELDAACAMKDWNPSHFLDVAEMASAVATGYDWLYPSLSPEQKNHYEQALIRNALHPAKSLYDTGVWWASARNNWGQVCGSGIAIAAAAVAEKDEKLTEDLFSRGIQLITASNHFYAPDGMYPEGPGYWHYGTNYHTLLLATCQTLGRDIQISPMLEKSGDSIMHLTGPSLLPFNFADGHAHKTLPSFAQCWIASHFMNVTQTHDIRSQYSKALESKDSSIIHHWSPLKILCLPSPTESAVKLTTAATFHGEQTVAIFRSDWAPASAWLAMKGGTPAGGHSHMDVGSFCYDAHGTRWFHDLGGDDYNMPGYFGSARFDYFRLQNRSHNTLEIHHQLQNPKAKTSPILSASITTNPATACFDLTPAYSSAAQKVIRSASFDRKSGIALIHDEITEPKGDVVWRAYTDAKCRIDDDKVILTKEHQHITLTRLTETGTWSISDARAPLAIENQNEKFRAVVLTMPKESRISIRVEIRP